MNKLAVIEAEAAEELEQLKVSIVDYDREVRSAFARQMGYAFLAGVALLRAKEIIPHGKFLEWREAELPEVSRSSASRYTQFAEALRKDPTVGSLREVRLLDNGGELTEEQQAKVAKVVHKLADGKTLTEMYRDLGVIRQPEKPKHHPRKETTIAQEYQSKQEQDLELLNGWINPARLWRDLVNANDKHSPEYSKATLKTALDEALQLTELLREMLKGAA